MSQKSAWDGLDQPDELAPRTRLNVPTIQWLTQTSIVEVNGEHPASGGFFHTDRHGILSMPGEPASYRADLGTFATSLVAAAVLAMRTRWVVKDGKFERLATGDDTGARRRVQMLVLLNDAEGVPHLAKITTVGRCNDGLPETYSALATKARIAGALPSMFYLNFKAGELQVKGDFGQQMTPILVSVPEDLNAAFIGAENWRLVTSLADEIAAWRDDADWNGESDTDGDKPPSALGEVGDVTVNSKTYGQGPVSLNFLAANDIVLLRKIVAYVEEKDQETVSQALQLGVEAGRDWLDKQDGENKENTETDEVP